MCLKWLSKGIRINKAQLNEAFDFIDKDDDGFADMEELITAIKTLFKK